MIRTITDFYSFIFQEEDGVIAAYFKTNSGTEYRVYFYPLPDYFENDTLSADSVLYRFGFFFGFTKLAPNEEKKEPVDFRVRNTILVIINDFFSELGGDKILIFYCDDGDGKKSKRAICFDNWYQLAETKLCFRKYDEEIIITNEEGESIDTDYMSLILECANPNVETILEEFQHMKENFIANK